MILSVLSITLFKISILLLLLLSETFVQKFDVLPRNGITLYEINLSEMSHFSDKSTLPLFQKYFLLMKYLLVKLIHSCNESRILILIELIQKFFSPDYLNNQKIK